MEIIKWLEDWYQSNCDGDWEHTYGIKISTIDNPGWGVEIDVSDTFLEDMIVEYSLIEKSEEDWYGYSIKEGMFLGIGDPSKLLFLLNLFREIVEKQS